MLFPLLKGSVKCGLWVKDQFLKEYYILILSPFLCREHVQVLGGCDGGYGSAQPVQAENCFIFTQYFYSLNKSCPLGPRSENILGNMDYTS